MAEPTDIYDDSGICVGVFICACGHAKASHRPHGGRRRPSSGWVCRKQGCTCTQYGEFGVSIMLTPAGAQRDQEAPRG